MAAPCAAIVGATATSPELVFFSGLVNTRQVFLLRLRRDLDLQTNDLVAWVRGRPNGRPLSLTGPFPENFFSKLTEFPVGN